jgi:hypothetical protein
MENYILQTFLIDCYYNLGHGGLFVREPKKKKKKMIF